jgi:hypothetical protein
VVVGLLIDEGVFAVAVAAAMLSTTPAVAATALRQYRWPITEDERIGDTPQPDDVASGHRRQACRDLLIALTDCADQRPRSTSADC